MVALIGCASQDNHVVDADDAGDVGGDVDYIAICLVGPVVHL